MRYNYIVTTPIPTYSVGREISVITAVYMTALHGSCCCGVRMT